MQIPDLLSKLETSIEVLRLPKTRDKQFFPTQRALAYARAIKEVRDVLGELVEVYERQYDRHKRENIRYNLIFEASQLEEREEQKALKGNDTQANNPREEASGEDGVLERDKD